MKVKGFLTAAAAALMMCSSVFGADPTLCVSGEDGTIYGLSKDLSASSEIKYVEDITLLFINGDYIYEADPVIKNGTTLVPLRIISDKLGADVSWDSSTKTANITQGNKAVSVTIGNSYITVDGNVVETTAPAQIIDSSTYVPLRAIASALGAEVGYDNKCLFVGYYANNTYSDKAVNIVWVQNRTDTPVISEAEAVQKAEDIFFDFLSTMRDHVLSYSSIDLNNVTPDNIDSELSIFNFGNYVCRCEGDIGQYYYVRYFNGNIWGVLIDKYDGSAYPIKKNDVIELRIYEKDDFSTWGIYFQ